MPLNRDDIINEATIAGSKGITCTRADLRINPLTRNIRIDFHLADITVLDDGRYFETPRMPVTLDLADGTGIKTFPIYNRRTGQPAAGGQTRQYDLLTRDIMSAFFHAYATAPQQP
jgi:hypothetical protein